MLTVSFDVFAKNLKVNKCAFKRGLNEFLLQSQVGVAHHQVRSDTNKAKLC